MEEENPQAEVLVDMGALRGIFGMPAGKARLREIVRSFEANKTDLDPSTIMDAYHRLNEMGEYHLERLIDDYLLGKLDSSQAKVLEDHISSCHKCKKDVAAMSVFIGGLKKL